MYMKKFIYTILALAAVTLVSCDQRGKDKDVKFDTVSASEGIAGTYNGTWTYVKNTEEPATVEGSIVFTATEDKYVANITVASVDGNLNLSGIANVAHANLGYMFYNNVGLVVDATTNAAFSGQVNEDKSITIQFTYEKPNGRKKDKYTYSFLGSK